MPIGTNEGIWRYPVKGEGSDSGAEPAAIAWVESFCLTLDSEKHSVPIAAGETLLQAALVAGIDAPHSCTEGRCGTCMAWLRMWRRIHGHHSGAVETQHRTRLRSCLPVAALVCCPDLARLRYLARMIFRFVGGEIE